jgi:hypothetical protein
LSFLKEKSWSVKLQKGYLLNGQIRAEQCKGCESTTRLIVGNNGDPNLLLYGCQGRKCTHTLIRMKFINEDPNPMIMIEPIERLQELSQSE